MKGTLGALWGVGGIAASIVFALVRITPYSVGAFEHPLEATHWIALAIWVPGMAWGEGVLGFHRSFSRAVAARARHLRAHPRTTHVALAPLYCLGLLHSTRRRKLRSGSLTIGIVILVLAIRALPQPWRGIIDLGVVAGLGIGLASMLGLTARALTAASFEAPADLPPQRGRA